MAKVRFLGHAAFYLEGRGIRALVDPFLTGNPQAPVGPSYFRELDYLFVTHGHGDHLGDAVEIGRRTGATAVAVFELANYLQSRGLKVHSMHVGGRYRFPFGSVKVTPALHGSGIIEGSEIIYGGNPCGFVIEVEGKKLYFAGDTGLSAEMGLLQHEPVEVAFLPIGGNYVMDVKDAAIAVDLIKPRVVVPFHYNTWPVIEAKPQEFVSLVGDRAKVVVLAPGEEMEV